MLVPIPMQFASTFEQEIVSTVASTVKNVSIGILILIIIGQLLGRGIIRHVWSLFCSVQIIIVMEHFRSGQPANM